MYLQEKSLRNKVKLENNEFYCVRCKQAVVPNKVYKYVNGVVGGFKPSVRLEGTCPLCSGIVNRFTSKDALPTEDGKEIIGALEYPLKD